MSKRDRKPGATPKPPDPKPGVGADGAGNETPPPNGIGTPPPEAEPDRLAQPVDHEQPPRLPFPVVGIGASAGGLEAVTEFFKVMPADSGMAFVLIQHLPPDRESMIAEIIGRHTRMRVQQVEDGMPVEPDHVYVIRPGHTLTIHQGRLHLGAPVERPKHGRPVDDFFRSLAEEQRERGICIVMSGMGSNGAAGAQTVKAVGGLCIAQEPESAQFPSMPRHLIDAGHADYTLRPGDMPDVLIAYARHPYATDRGDSHRIIRRELQQIREILAILRTRTRHDYSGYRKPTLLRRIQRRMGLNRLTRLGDYAALLRQNPTEATALADDLLIHVTGFFRDEHAWEALRREVIAPLVASREPDSAVRCWVTACSSGEEAYSLAILLVEECERAGKPIDIKIFATDTAERTLGNARNGVYPGGIEAELSADRLSRFFQRDDAVYRIRQDLRERVVFAPQNVLVDPPFSRLDIVTCRNLLIYLEPDVQQRVLELLHFGLKPGGALFLGTSETVAGSDDMFTPVDKKARIFKRVGPTRHGVVEFPPPRGLIQAAEAVRTEGHAGPRPSVAQLTARTLLARHIPAAVTVDREMRVLYFQGHTAPYLHNPTGEPSRDLMVLAAESVRGAVRTALQKAIAENTTARALDGWVQTPEGPRRIVVRASPIEPRSGQPSDLFVVSFEEREEAPPDAAPASPPGETAEELARVRDELQTTIEELQTSNEEHKAATEEIMSINEELQSSNEELETSKEEMQSLNEELTTVNTQLQSKMEELQTTTNDLASLLSSTDIAVIFLDESFRIRRFTPAATKLMDLISTDVGRPLKDLAKKFTDPQMLEDARSVLETLVPLQKDVAGELGRWYVRRILPYRTVDNHIRGVVVTFVDVTEQKNAQSALRMTEQQLAGELKAITSLHDVTRSFSSPDLHEAMDEVLRACLSVDASEMGTLHLYDPKSRTLRLMSQRGLSGEFVERFQEIRVTDHTHAARGPGETGPPVEGARDAGLAIVRAASRAERVIITDFESSSAGDRAAAAIGPFQSLQCTPLMTRQRELMGVLSTYSTRARRQTDHEHRVMDIFGRQASDLLERLLAERELTRLLRTEQAARAALDEGVRLKDEFLAVLSHELRTPLSAILGWARVLQHPSVEAASLHEGLASIAASGQSLARLVDDLLDTSRAAAGKLRLELAPLEVADLVTEAVEAIKPTAEAKEVSVTASVQTGRTLVMADAERLRQIFWNLLHNAVKFTPPGGRVSISAAREGSEIVVVVADSGTGISPEFLPFVFDRFRQYDPGRARRQGGLGLGLAIAKQLVELHGGTITAASPGLERGSIFTVRLPLPAAANPDARRLAGEATDLAGVRVLLVEDDAPTRAAVREILRQAGAHVATAGSAPEALAAFGEARPDVIVSDIGLPEVDGYALLSQIRELEAMEKTDRVPAIALTAYVAEEDRARTSRAGFGIHVAKPVEPERLAAAIRTLVSK